MNWLIEKPFAHRGLHREEDWVPELSMLSFQKAIEQNIPLEIDVQLCKDGTVVVFHDKDLQRMCGSKKLIKELKLEEIKSFRLKNSSEQIPSLAEVFAFVDRQVPILIEIKNKQLPGKLENAVYKEIQKYSGDIAIMSFNPLSVWWFKKNAPHIIRGQLASSNGKKIGIQKWHAKNLPLNYATKPHFIGYDVENLATVNSQKWKRKSVYILSWTIDSDEKKTVALKLADNYIFEKIVFEAKKSSEIDVK